MRADTLKALATVEAAEVESSVRADDAISAGIEAAFIGRCRVDLASNDPPLVFGTINDRPVHEPAVTGLQKAFKREGIRRYQPENAIQVSFNLEDINKDVLGKREKPYAELPMISQVLRNKVKVMPYSGRHRCFAMRGLKDVLEQEMVGLYEEMTEMEAEMKEVETNKAKKSNNQETVEKLEEALLQLKTKHEGLRERVARYKGLILSGTEWLLEVYDRGELDDNERSRRTDRELDGSETFG